MEFILFTSYLLQDLIYQLEIAKDAKKENVIQD